ncbi:vacuolar protein sorting-associated protein 70 [Coprinopsis cinerea okayama7|uniref:Vacuolar protein sorting-associated protein 70 n=1 Tax=Coprinopsis cinerea (strain Okayama-7 / 130 / ATCC MYA-4618 / FGSC 9003) TaxID=240176 RepID=A8NX37_COPC7|nr:vacuolar protein sorting-associated protein 70 [Coprinopsis cinerea okayama7\|eukprot:XP_001837057.2 vacuolar protein sorting-associated protein 70 [Coprinopsis cinerea okayama7\
MGSRPSERAAACIQDARDNRNGNTQSSIMAKVYQVPEVALPLDDNDGPRGSLVSSGWKRIVIIGLGALALTSFFKYPHGHPRKRSPRLNATEAERLFLTVPNAESALGASRKYATHPHLAGAPEDFEDARTILRLFQQEFGIRKPKEEPIFRAGSRQSRHATLGLTRGFLPKRPTAWIDTYFPILNTPLDRHLQKKKATHWTEDAAKYRLAVPVWHGLSFHGEATGNLVYANYGTQEDYKVLLEKGVNFTDKIVLTRYGRIFRGLKVKAQAPLPQRPLLAHHYNQIKGAQELGAAGVLIYSDPRDDGVVTVDNGYSPYPQGPARNPSSVQRGSVQYLSLYPGDPTTPGYPAYEDAIRQEGVNIPSIPSLPISWANAQVLLKELKGADETTTSDERQLSGRISKRKVKVRNHVDNKVTPIWNTMSSIPGHIKDEVVLIGCHRDGIQLVVLLLLPRLTFVWPAWGLGAADPTSGTVSLHEMIRGLVVIASWDGEEYGLVGSTEWGEDFEQWISDHVVAYLNVDVSVDGSRFNVGASPSLALLIKRTAQDILHPTDSNRTLWDARNDEGPYKGFNASSVDPDFGRMYEADEAERKSIATGVTSLGSGSDYTVFLQRIGVSPLRLFLEDILNVLSFQVASSDQGFGPTPSDPVYHYHSIYDSQRWQEVYGDPTFERHVAIAKHLGLLGLRLADSIIIPLNTTQYALELDDYLDKVVSLTSKKSNLNPDFSTLRKSIKHVQHASLALDHEKVEAEKKFKEILAKLPHQRPHGAHHRVVQVWRFVKYQMSRAFGFITGPETPHRRQCRGGHSAEGLLEMASSVEESELDKFPFPVRKFIKAAKRVGRANKKLIAFERGFISKDGIRDREWYRHLGVAPGKWLGGGTTKVARVGYGATTLPALTEAIAEKLNATEVQYEIDRLVELLDNLAKRIHP